VTDIDPADLADKIFKTLSDIWDEYAKTKPEVSKRLEHLMDEAMYLILHIESGRSYYSSNDNPFADEYERTQWNETNS